MRVNRATILQIATLPPGYWVDEHNPCVGIALVEMDIQYDDDRADEETVRDVFPLDETLGVVGLTGFDGEPYYLAHGLGDHKEVTVRYAPDHVEGERFR